MIGGSNTYVYGLDNPITNIDPRGLVPSCKELFRIPINFDRNVEENFDEWGKWKFAFTITAGGESPNPFLAVNCVCKRSRDGKRHTVYKINWYIVEKCTNCDGNNEITTRKQWETVSDKTRDIKNSEQKIIPGGFRGNETSAEFLCIEKCKNLNL